MSSTLALPSILPVPVSQQIRSGSRPQPAAINPWEVTQLLGSHTTAQSAVQYNYGPGVLLPQSSAGTSHSHYRDSGPSQTSRVVASKRKARSCTSCHRADCGGRWNSKKCQFPKVHLLIYVTCGMPILIMHPYSQLPRKIEKLLLRRSAATSSLLPTFSVPRLAPDRRFVHVSVF